MTSFGEPPAVKTPYAERWPSGGPDAFLSVPSWVGGSPIRVASCSGVDWVAAASPSGVLVLARGQGRALPMAGALPAVIESSIATSHTEPAEDGLPPAVATVVRLLRAVHQDLRQENPGNEGEGLEALIALAVPGRVFVVNAGGGATFRRRRQGRWETVAPVGDRARPVLGTETRALIEVASEPLRSGDLVLAIASVHAEIVTAERIARSAITAWANFQNPVVSPLAGDPGWALLLHGEPHGLVGPDLFPGRKPVIPQAPSPVPQPSPVAPQSPVSPVEIPLREILRADMARAETPLPFTTADSPLPGDAAARFETTLIPAERVSSGDLVMIEMLPGEPLSPSASPPPAPSVPVIHESLPAEAVADVPLEAGADDRRTTGGEDVATPLAPLAREITKVEAARSHRSHPWRRRVAIGLGAVVLGAGLSLGVRDRLHRHSDSSSSSRVGRMQERTVASSAKQVGSPTSESSGPPALSAPPSSPPGASAPASSEAEPSSTPASLSPIAASSSSVPSVLPGIGSPGSTPGSVPAGDGAFVLGFGGISVRTEPAAPDIEVFLDEKPVGRAPIGLDHVAPGRHHVRFRGPEHYHWEEEVMVRAGEMAQAVALVEHVGELAEVTVRSSILDEGGLQQQQGDEVKVDGVASGKTPVDLDLSAGVHAIEVKRKGTTPIIRVVELRRSDRLIIDVRVDEDPPFVIDHTPPAAALRADGTLILTVQCRGLDPAARPRLYLHYAIDDSWDRLPMGEVPGALGTYVIGLPITPDRAKKKLRYYFSTGSEWADAAPVYSPIFSVTLR